MPTAGCRAPGRICVPEVQLPLPTFNASVSPMTNHRVCNYRPKEKGGYFAFSSSVPDTASSVRDSRTRTLWPWVLHKLYLLWREGKDSILAFRAQADLGFKRHKHQTIARNSHGFDRKNYKSEGNTFAGTMTLSLKHFLK